ncbi:MAG TPA: copper chaperone PCu(A)C [Pseudomonadales bacterium]|jgi:hypothetical protein
MKSLWLCLLLCVSGVAAADAVVRVESPQVRETLPAQTVSSAYLTVINDGAADAVLIAASSDRSPRVEIHEHRHDNGMMQMRKLESVVVPAQGRLVFETGGLHLMLLDLPAPLRVGESVTLTLQFQDGSQVTVSAPVNSLQQTLQAPAPKHHH